MLAHGKPAIIYDVSDDIFIKKYGRAIVIIGEGYKIKDFNIYKDFN